MLEMLIGFADMSLFFRSRHRDVGTPVADSAALQGYPVKLALPRIRRALRLARTCPN
ncbi:MAG: hypothetical protein ACREC9_03895 [Methylocella sp.]